MMKCPYCAEEIQDNAVICRYCLASKVNGKWQHTATTTTPAAVSAGSPRFTIRSAAVFFILSAIAEIVSISSPVSLFGSMHSGFAVFIYHLIYIAIYLGMGFGLWAAMPWGFKYVLGSTIFYTLDKVQYLLSGQASAKIITEYGAFLGSEGQTMVSWVSTLTFGLSIVGWWGFVLYLYFKRDYFASVTR